ncbi:MAG: glycosyltransferase family 2 protein [Candidatus Omnitrophica bacterium]|nr:glycosyltransferase family 2 protein [Candidatus Omnitrophota bacterium]
MTVYANIVHTVFVIMLVYFLILAVYYIFLALIGSIEGAGKAFEGSVADYTPLYFSAFKIPVTIIVPAHNEEEWMEDSLKALLSLNYPEFEIIVVNDGSTDRTFSILDKILRLKPVDTVQVKHYLDGVVNDTMKSVSHPNVTVINKKAGAKKAGAVNAGLNMAKYNYVCVMDADTILERDSLIKVMAHVARDPDRIIGIGSYFGLVNDFRVKEGVIVERNFSYNPIIAYQNLEYIRSFIGNRLAWSRYNAMPTVAGGFGVWRKDFLYEQGGYSLDFTCEDIELTFRAHDYAAKNRKKGYRIVMLPYCVGWTEGPHNIASLISQRARWQRVTIETMWAYRYMMCEPKYGAFAFLTMPYMLFYEVLGVFMEMASLAFVAFGWLTGVLQFNVFIAFFALMLLLQAFTSLLSILTFVQGQRVFRMKYIVYMIFLTLIEFFWYRWIISIAKVRGTIDFLFRKKTFDQYARAKRAWAETPQ